MRITLYNGQNPEEKRLKSRKCFLCSVKSADFHPKVIRCSAWLRRLQAIPHRITVTRNDNYSSHSAVGKRVGLGNFERAG